MNKNNVQPAHQVALTLMQDYLFENFPEEFIEAVDRVMPWENDNTLNVTYKKAWELHHKFILDDYDEFRKIIETLCSNEYLVNLFSQDERGFSSCFIAPSKVYVLHCSDVFHLCAADAEAFDEKDAILLSAIKTVLGWEGLMAWIAVRRNYDPTFYKINKEKFLHAKKTVEYVYKLYYTLDENFCATDDDKILSELDELWMKSDKDSVDAINVLLPKPIIDEQ